MKNYCTINTDKYRLTERTIDLLNTHGSPIATPDYMCYIVCFPDIEAVLAVDIGVTGSWQVFPADPRGKCGKRKQKKYLEYLLDMGVIEPKIEEPFEEFRREINFDIANNKIQLIPPQCKLDPTEVEKGFRGDDNIGELEEVLGGSI